MTCLISVTIQATKFPFFFWHLGTLVIHQPKNNNVCCFFFFFLFFLEINIFSAIITEDTVIFPVSGNFYNFSAKFTHT